MKRDRWYTLSSQGRGQKSKRRAAYYALARGPAKTVIVYHDDQRRREDELVLKRGLFYHNGRAGQHTGLRCPLVSSPEEMEAS